MDVKAAFKNGIGCAMVFFAGMTVAQAASVSKDDLKKVEQEVFQQT